MWGRGEMMGLFLTFIKEEEKTEASLPTSSAFQKQRDPFVWFLLSRGRPPGVRPKPSGWSRSSTAHLRRSGSKPGWEASCKFGDALCELTVPNTRS